MIDHVSHSQQGALFESEHFDNNDVQTISHKCLVLPYRKYVEEKKRQARPEEGGEGETSTPSPSATAVAAVDTEETDDDPTNIYYFSGLYDPLSGQISIDEEVPFRSCD